MGEVWRARHLLTNERVAVKVLLADLAQDPAVQKRFLREARAAAAVKHPNVVELRDVQQSEDGAPFLVMELLTGETLGRRLRRRGMLSVAEVAAIFLPVFDAVEAAHAAGLVHRDLKPENIFLAHDGAGAELRVRVRVLDFGIAKQVEKLGAPSASSAAATAPAETTAAMLGTPYYMAPEQALGERDIDGRADIWSIGVVLYECLTGRRPTEAGTLGAILKIIVTDGVVPIQSVLPELDRSLAEALMQMLRTSRDARSPSLDAMRDRLSSLRDPSYVLETDTDEGIPASVQRPSPEDAPLAPVARAPGFKPLPWLGGLGVAALGLALLVRSLVGAGAAPVVSTAASVAQVSAPAVTPTAGATTTTTTTTTTTATATATSIATASASASATTSGVMTPTATPTASAPAPPSATGDARPKVRRLSSASAAGPPAIASAPASAAPASAPSRGPSGLVTDNPFGGPTPSAPR